jgi:N-acetylmuramoyl-L-alanine amidase
MDLSQDASIGASLEAAQRVLAELDQVGTVRKSQVQQAAFLVLKSPDIPSMLVETAYISNPGEERKLRDPAYQQELAEAIFRGVREHFRRSPPEGTLFARQQKPRGGTPIIAGSATP